MNYIHRYNLNLNQNVHPKCLHNSDQLILIIKDAIAKNYNDVKIAYNINPTYILLSVIIKFRYGEDRIQFDQAMIIIT